MTPTSAQIRRDYWRRQRAAEWHDAPIGTLRPSMLQRGTAARARRLERPL